MRCEVAVTNHACAGWTDDEMIEGMYFLVSRGTTTYHGVPRTSHYPICK